MRGLAKRLLNNPEVFFRSGYFGARNANPEAGSWAASWYLKVPACL